MVWWKLYFFETLTGNHSLIFERHTDAVVAPVAKTMLMRRSVPVSLWRLPHIRRSFSNLNVCLGGASLSETVSGQWGAPEMIGAIWSSRRANGLLIRLWGAHRRVSLIVHEYQCREQVQSLSISLGSYHLMAGKWLYLATSCDYTSEQMWMKDVTHI